MKRLLFAVLLLAIAEARIEFKQTVLYDMYDLKGTPNYPITICGPGCRVYLTYPNDECPRPPPAPCNGDGYNGGVTILVGDDYNITFKELNELRLDNGEKGYFDIPEGTDHFILHNPNGNLAVFPLALWIVPNDIDKSIQDMEVYEAEEGTQIATTTRAVVLMNVYPFTITGAIDGEYELFVKPSGIDMINTDECEHVLDIGSSTSQTFSLPVSSPLISLGFNSGDPAFKATLKTDLSFAYERSIDASGYMATPGYIGCANKTFVFRSDTYNFGVTSYNQTFLVDGDKAMNVSFYGDINTDERVPILLYDMDTDNEPLEILGSQAENTSTWEYQMTTSKFSLYCDGSAMSSWRNESYMIRYTVELPKVSPGPIVTKPTVPTVTKTVATVPTVSVVTKADATTEFISSSLAPDTSPLISTTVAPTTSVSSLKSVTTVFSVVFVFLLL